MLSRNFGPMSKNASSTSVIDIRRSRTKTRWPLASIACYSRLSQSPVKNGSATSTSLIFKFALVNSTRTPFWPNYTRTTRLEAIRCGRKRRASNSLWERSAAMSTGAPSLPLAPLQTTRRESYLIMTVWLFPWKQLGSSGNGDRHGQSPQKPAGESPSAKRARRSRRAVITRQSPR